MNKSEQSVNSKSNILIVDDEESMCEVLSHILTTEGYTVKTASTGQDAISTFEKNPFDVVIQDIKMPNVNGLDLVRKYKDTNPSTMIIVITAFSTLQIAVEAMRLGAYDYLRKPFNDNQMIKTTVQRALQAKNLLKKQEEKPIFRPFIGNSPEIQNIYQLIQQVSITDSPILIQGENGTGKELVARTLHYSSARADGPFIAVNCGAFPENLLESELFGHVKGSFTTALYDKKGLLEVAQKGTFFLDELSELSPAMQVKLLRVIEEREIKPVGGNKTKKIDVRFIAATNTDLETRVKRKEFREDLFYRLNVIIINLPALKSRRDDIPLLAGYFLDKYNKSLKKSVKNFSPAALELLINYDWPGNVRELENAVQRAIILAKEPSIQPDDLTPKLQGKWGFQEAKKKPIAALYPDGIDLEKKVKIIEMEHIQQALKLSKDNITKAADLLKLPTRSLRYKMKKYGIKKDK